MSASLEPATAEVLLAAAQNVLEVAAFAFADDAEGEEAVLEEPGWLATLNMSGDLTAVLRIAAPMSLCKTLAADMVGLDADEIESRQAADVLGELANVISGQLATDLLGEESVVDLAPPTSESIGSDQWNLLTSRCSARLLLIDDQPFVLDLQINADT